jgi:long-chain acyl-CoA synthetase
VGGSLRAQNVAEILTPVLDRAPEREALVTVSGRWTYAELDRECEAAADALVRLGVGPGDRVAACLPNDVDVVTAFHAVMRLGAVWVGINQALAAPEKAFIVSDSGPSLLLGDEAVVAELGDSAGGVRLVGRAGGVRLVGRAGGVRLVDIAGPAWRDGLDEAAVSGRARPEIDPHAPAAIAYTSGTTGYPKGAVHSQHNLLMPGAAVVASRGWGPELRKGDCLPLTILNMLVLTTLLVAQAGGTCVVMDQVEAGSVADWIQREKVTVWNGVPALLHTMVHADRVPASALASLEELWVGGADCPDSLRGEVAVKFGLALTHTYGLTEAPTIVTIDPPSGRAGDDPHRAGASGVALPHLAVRVIGDDGAERPAGDSGEICVAVGAELDGLGSYTPPLGYWDRSEATADLLAGGLLHTGDVGFLDEDGFLHLRDRKNQMILRGGANVYPAEVERVLVARPEVEAAAVFGLEDERLGQRVAAAVQLTAGASISIEELAAACAQELARYKVPERWVLVDSFARNSMGKIDRRVLPGLLPVL